MALIIPPPSPQAYLRNIEQTELPLGSIVLKVIRLARLVSSFTWQAIMEYEASGYPTAPDGVPAEVYRLAATAGRDWEVSDPRHEEN